MKYVLLLLSTMIISLKIYSQATFSQRLHLERSANVFTGIDIEEDAFWVKGVSASFDPSYRTGSVLAKFGYNGELIFSSFFENQEQSFETWSGDLRRLTDSLLYTIGYSEGETRYGFILTYNNQGQPVIQRDFLNAFNNGGSIYPKSVVQLYDGFVVSAESGGGVGGSTYAQLMRFDQDFEPLWEKSLFPTTAFSEEPRSLSQIESDQFVYGGLIHNYNLTDNNFTLKTHLRHFDQQGNTIWEWSSNNDELQLGANSIFVTEVNSIVVASALGVEEPVNAISSKVLWDCLVYELDFDGNLLWETLLRLDRPNELNKLNKVIKCSDESGYIVVGRQYVSYETGGTSTETNTFDVGGYIGKLSLDGDSIWSRLIIHPDLPSFVDFHEIWDIQESPAGGYICVGESSDFLQQDQPQQGWILKVDEYGCLVPDCHLISSTDETYSQGAVLFKLFPNPTVGTLNIYLSEQLEDVEAELTIVNTEGKVMQRFDLAPVAATYSLDTSHWPSGSYFVHVSSADGNAIASKKFLKN